jgi:hypothetical protein
MIPFLALLIATAFAADSEIAPNPGAIVDGNPAGSATAIQTAPKRPPRPPRARVSTS